MTLSIQSPKPESQKGHWRIDKECVRNTIKIKNTVSVEKNYTKSPQNKIIV
jgi:hypothetical protein